MISSSKHSTNSKQNPLQTPQLKEKKSQNEVSFANCPSYKVVYKVPLLFKTIYLSLFSKRVHLFLRLIGQLAKKDIYIVSCWISKGNLSVC